MKTYADGTNVSYSMRVKVGEEGAELPVLMSEDGTAAASKQTKYTIQRIENSVDSLTPKRKLAYRFLWCGHDHVSVIVFDCWNFVVWIPIFIGRNFLFR